MVTLTIKEKRCNRCKEVKDISGFHKNKAQPDGFRYTCKECRKIDDANNREKLNEYQRKYRIINKKKHSESNKLYYVINRQKVLEQVRYYRHSMSKVEYDRLLASQCDKCAICSIKLKDGDMALDHDHKCCDTKRTCGKCIRGILCGGCNRGIGHFKESIDSLRMAIIYLEKHKNRG